MTPRIVSPQLRAIFAQSRNPPKSATAGDLFASSYSCRTPPHFTTTSRHSVATSGLGRYSDARAQGGFNWSSQHLVMEVFRWELASVRVRFERCVARCGHLAGPRQRGARTGSGSGRRSLVGRPARTPQQRLGCRRLSGRDGSGKLVECDLSRWLRCRGVICRSPSVKRSPSFTLSMLGYVRSLAAWVVHRRRFRGSCAATRRLAAVP